MAYLAAWTELKCNIASSVLAIIPLNEKWILFGQNFNSTEWKTSRFPLCMNFVQCFKSFKVFLIFTIFSKAMYALTCFDQQLLFHFPFRNFFVFTTFEMFITNPSIFIRKTILLKTWNQGLNQPELKRPKVELLFWIPDFVEGIPYNHSCLSVSVSKISVNLPRT